MVYDGGTTKYFSASPAINSGLTGLTGTVKSYSGILELIPTVAAAAATSTNNTPFPIVTTTLDNLINYPLQVCKVNNVKISDFTQFTSSSVTYTPDGTFQFGKSGVNFPLSFGGVTSTTVLRTSYPDVNYIGTPVPLTVNQNITGIVLPYQSSATATPIVDFIPRSLSDFQAVTGLNTPSADVLSVSLVGQNLTVTNTTNGFEVYNAVGTKVRVALQNTLNVSDLSKGVYIVRSGNSTAKIML